MELMRILRQGEVWKLSLLTEVCRKSNETLSIMDRNGRVCCSPNGVSLAVRQAGPGYLQGLFVLQGEEKKGRELIREGISIRNSLSNCLYVAAGYCDLGSK